MGRVKGAGVDCAMFPLEVYREAGLIGHIEIPYYPPDWMLHRSEEIFLRIVQRVLLCLAISSFIASGGALPMVRLFSSGPR